MLRMVQGGQPLMTVLPRYVLCWYNLNFLIISIANSRSKDH